MDYGLVTYFSIQTFTPPIIPFFQMSVFTGFRGGFSAKFLSAGSLVSKNVDLELKL